MGNISPFRSAATSQLDSTESRRPFSPLVTSLSSWSTPEPSLMPSQIRRRELWMRLMNNLQLLFLSPRRGTAGLELLVNLTDKLVAKLADDTFLRRSMLFVCLSPFVF